MNANLPYAVRRPWLITKDLLRSRANPDIASLHAVRDPEVFLWRVLPHAARTFAACIALLPTEFARAAAVAYLYCRILDTYEDLLPNPAEREAALAGFGRRFRGPEGGVPPPAPTIAAHHAREPRDRTHLVLVERSAMLDAVYATLPPPVQRHIAHLVEPMAEGMISSSRALAAQGGVLRDGEQLSRYCRTVIGLPFLFSVRLLLERHGETAVSEAVREDCLAAGEMVQLANMTRDIEKDLRRGVAYHPVLAADVGRSDGDDPALRRRIAAVREELLLRALALAPAYQRMMAALPFHALSLARASGVLMLLFTDRHYRWCARHVGLKPWPGPRSTVALMLLSFGHFASARLAARTVRRITERFVRFALTHQRPSTSL